MVMERDGKFEVMSAVDLQASTGLHQEDRSSQQLHHTITSDHQPPNEESCLQERLAKDQNCTKPPEQQVENAGRLLEAANNDENVTSCKAEKDEEKQAKALDLESSKPDEKREQSNEAQQTHHQLLPREVPSSSTESKDTEDSEKGFPPNVPSSKTEPTPPLDKPPSPLHSPGVKSQEEMVKSQLHIRTQSAPISKISKLAQRREEEEKEKRKRMSEAAYSAWIAKKDEERRQRLEVEKLISATTAKNDKQKKEMCEKVYQNWLETKNRELQSQRLQQSRPSTSVPKKDEDQCRQAFETWLEKKRTQQNEETKKERVRTQEMEETARKVDPTVIDTVYKE